MAAGEEEQNRRERRGFAGLSSLMSDVDTLVGRPAKQEAAGGGVSPGSERPIASASAQPEPQPVRQQPYQAPARPPSGSSAGKWVLGIAAALAVLWFIGEGKKSPPYTAPAYSPPAPYTAPSYSAAPVQPQPPSRPEEARPPVGLDLVLSPAEIRYCLAEDIRMDGARSALDNYSDSDVGRFNAMVGDFNSRCGRFRYRRDEMESARREVESYRSELHAEGRSRFARSPSTGLLPAPAPRRPAPAATERGVQLKPTGPGYDSGFADGLIGRGTCGAVVVCQQERDEAARGAAGHARVRQLREASPGRGRESCAAKTAVHWAPAAAALREAACAADRYAKGLAACRASVERTKGAVPAGESGPDRNAVAAGEQQFAEAAYGSGKYGSGSAARSQCEANERPAMFGQVARPSALPRLSSTAMQSSEAAC